MSKTTTVVAAAMAAALTVASFQPAEATNNGLSPKQIKALIKQEVAKIPRVQGPAGPRGSIGPAGPPGPPGMDGLQGEMLFAFVSPFGTVDPATSSGITDENIVYQDYPSPPNPTVIFSSYCFIGLPPVRGGQVTSGIGDGFFPAVTLNFPSVR